MRVIIICFLFTSLFSISYGQDLETLKKEIWESDKPHNSIIKVPEKWENESAVILYREFGYIYEAKGPKIDYRESIRQRIKLQDKSAIETYSEFTFAEKFEVSSGFTSRGGKVLAAFKVIKPDGTEKEIDMDKAVQIEGEGNEKIRKVAVPDLEEGDILDYFYYAIEPFRVLNLHRFEPIISTIQGDYPIVEQKISFQVENDFYVNFNSYNGAPKLEIENTSYKAGRTVFNQKEKTTTYALIDKDREKAGDTRWIYARRVLPVIKFRVYFAKAATAMALESVAFVGKEGAVKKSVTRDEVSNFMRYSLVDKGKDPVLIKHLKSKGLYKVAGKEKEMLEEAYYFERYNHITSRLEFRAYGKGNKAFSKTSMGFSYGNNSFVKNFIHLLQAQKIDFEVIALVPRYLGDLDELLIEQELGYLIKVNLDEPYYLSPFNLFSTPGSFSEDYEGVEGYSMSLSGLYLRKMKRYTMPKTTYEDNNSYKSIQLNINEDMKTLSATRLTKHTGHNRSYGQYKGLKPYEFLKEDFDYFGAIMQPDINDKKHNSAEYKDQLKTIFEEEAQDQKDNLKEILESDYDITISSYETPKILSSGRMNENPEFMYQEEFEMEDLMKKAGKNYILEITKLIGSQVGLEEKESTRAYDVYYDHARSYDNEISLEIPEGYTVAGLDKLQKKVDNDMGHFISTATIEGTTLTIKTLKAYKTNFIAVEDWPKAVAFLEAAFQFTQEENFVEKELREFNYGLV